MIDVRTEQLLPARDLPAYLASRGFGKTVSTRTVRRWIEHGSEGIRLEAVRIGGVLMTSLEALQRWVVAQNPTSATPAPNNDARPSPRVAGPHAVPSKAETDHLLTEFRLKPTEVDRLLDTLVDCPESARAHVAGALFRCQIRRLSDLSRRTLDELLAIRGMGPRSAPVLRALWARLGS